MPSSSSYTSIASQELNLSVYPTILSEPAGLRRHQSKNRYYRHSRISEELFLGVLFGFTQDLTATESASQTGISIRSVNSIYLKLRRWLASNDNSGSNTAKQDVYTLAIKDDNNIVIHAISDKDSEVVKTLINAPTLTGDIQSWSQLDGAIALMSPNSSRLKRRLDIASKDHALLDQFWEYTRERLHRFNGIHKHTSSLHLQETAFRFNHRNNNMYVILVNKLEQYPI
jgi:transposase